MSHGLASNRYRITIDLSENPIADQVHESEENKVVYEALRERLKLLQTKHKKQLDDWIDSISRITCEVCLDVSLTNPGMILIIRS